MKGIHALPFLPTGMRYDIVEHEVRPFLPNFGGRVPKCASLASPAIDRVSSWWPWRHQRWLGLSAQARGLDKWIAAG